jgi:hypothetical protein
MNEYRQYNGPHPRMFAVLFACDDPRTSWFFQSHYRFQLQLTPFYMCMMFCLCETFPGWYNDVIVSPTQKNIVLRTRDINQPTVSPFRG